MYKHMLQLRTETESRRLFLQINCNRLRPEQIFKRQNLGKSFFERAVKTMCIEACVKGSGLNSYLTNHGLRGSMITYLVEAGHTECSIILRTGHSGDNFDSVSKSLRF